MEHFLFSAFVLYVILANHLEDEQLFEWMQFSQVKGFTLILDNFDNWTFDQDMSISSGFQLEHPEKMA